jgi:hypothetical protein
VVDVLNDLAIANMALTTELGEAPLQTFDDATHAGTAVKQTYARVINALLANYPWSFAKTLAPLTLLATTPQSDGRLINGWRYAYQLPADRLGAPLRAIVDPRCPDDPLKLYAIANDRLFADRAPLWVQYQARVDPSSWPAYFVDAAVACLAANLVMPISGNSGLLESKERKAWGTPEENGRGGALGAAIRSDARGNPSPSLLARDPLTSARYA